MAKAESLGQGRSWIWNPYRDPEQIKPELTSQFPILPWWLHGAAPPPDSLGHWEAEDGEALVPVLSIDSVGALFKIWIKIIQDDSILAQVLDQLFSSVPSLHGLARGYGEEHLAEAHIETCTPIPSQPSAPAQIWKCSLPLKLLLHSLRPCYLPWDVSFHVCSTFHQSVLDTAAMTNSSVLRQTRVQRSIAGGSVLLPEGWQRGKKDFFLQGQKTNPNHQTWPDRTKTAPTSTL